ncbi:hypothetical protein BD309DRAFT_892117 [Dichomitus squalens]|nr:hypothetical protein BD309DRAFT_892117 [Dichomitus squalens]
MSSSADSAEIARIIYDENAYMIEDLTGISPVAMFVYHYLITFGREVALFWRRPITGSSIIFFINRYLPLFVICYGTPWPLSSDLQSCKAEVWSKQLTEYFQYYPWAAFSALRVYALGGRNWFLAALVFILGCSGPIFHYVRLHWLRTFLYPGEGCTYSVTSIPVHLSAMLFIMNYSLSISADLLVLIVTWRATYNQGKGLAGLGQKKSLSGMLLRDGASYFVAITTVKSADFILGLLSIYGSFEYLSEVVYYEEPLTAILVSHFLMDLQEASTDATQGTSFDDSDGTINFNRVVGSMASSLPAPGEEAIMTQERDSEEGTGDEDLSVEEHEST